MKYLSTTFFLALLTAVGCGNSTAQKIQNTDAVEFRKLMESTSEKIILDVRTPGEYANGHIENAINMDVSSGDFQNKITTLDSNSTIFVYCLAGSRSSHAADILSQSGFHNIVNLQTGIMDWNAQNYPVIQGKNSTANSGMSHADFLALVNSETPTLIDFYAEWCLPCKKMKPFIEKIASENKENLILREIDYDRNTDLLKSLDVNSVPCLRIYKKGELIWNHPGAATEDEVRKAIEAIK